MGEQQVNSLIEELEAQKMEPNSERKSEFLKSWWVIVLAFLLVAVFPFVRSQSAWLQSFTDSFNLPFYTLETTDTATVEIAQIDTAILQDTLVTLQVDTAYLDSLNRVNYLDSIDAEAAKGLVSFFTQLQKLENDKNEKVSILWFGDSMIEGDMITQDVRDSLQRRFGGYGVGYMPITSVVNKFRNTIRHDFSDNWMSYNVVSGKKPHLTPNWNGEYFTAQHDSSLTAQIHDSLQVHFTGSSAFVGTRKLPKPALLYGKRVSDSAYQDTANWVKLDEDWWPLSDSQTVNRLEIDQESVSEITLDFLLKPDQPLYGMHFHSGAGIELSNIASRGNSGLVLSAVPAEIFHGMAANNAPSLIVLQYGVNASSLGVTDYSWYNRAMKRVVRYLQKVYPTTSIVIVSMADRCAKIDGEMQTDSSVIAMNKVLLNIATETEVSYFDLFNKMGGENSMKKWADAKPSLANKDYTHFNFRGSRKVAHFFIEFLMEQYSTFKKEQNSND